MGLRVREFVIPTNYQGFLDGWQRNGADYIRLYQTRQLSFIPNLLPVQALNFTAEQTLTILRNRFGNDLQVAIDPRFSDPAHIPENIHGSINSPVCKRVDGSWLKTTNMVGINVRTLGSFWNVVKYALTLSQSENSIHLLPVWQPGVVGSLYGMSSWQLNTEFYSEELQEALPYLNTVGKQLKVLVNILHLMGKTVGMDVIPHTDRFSEIVLAYPEFFEWLRRKDNEIVNHRANLHERVQELIIAFLKNEGAAVPGEKIPQNKEEFFAPSISEDLRLRTLFGFPGELKGRLRRRIALVKHLHSSGYETIPATMAPPYRGLKVDRREAAKKVDENGLIWQDYIIENPQPMSRVFGPLTRYKLYERLNDNIDWHIDFDRPRKEVWQYVCKKYCDFQYRYGFDFMRGDMSHVQMRPSGIPEKISPYYDLQCAIKNFIRKKNGKRYFGYFAESFLAPPNIMSFGDEIEHLEASEADTTLGDLQSTVVGSPDFIERLQQYADIKSNRLVTPNLTAMTADKDDPRFDKFYLKGNELRLFLGFFLTDMPCYIGAGFEIRDPHTQPAPNEHYSKLYIFQESIGPKMTSGPYVWGKNGRLFGNVIKIKFYLEKILDDIREQTTVWVISPNSKSKNKVIAWTQKKQSPKYLFLANLDIDNAENDIIIPRNTLNSMNSHIDVTFSTANHIWDCDKTIKSRDDFYQVKRLAEGEGRIYKINN